MGAYLSEPITEKISSDDDGERVRYGASSMQGWRVSQEDAHNCIIDFDKLTSLFAVYDGHGGSEVAAYCAQKLPNYIKETDAYKNGDLKTALIDAFLGFDATIATREVVAILKEIKGEDDENATDANSEDEENVRNLYEEASMPIEQVMEKYQANLLNPNLKKLQGEKFPVSPMLRARKFVESSSSGGESSSSGPSSSSADCKSEVTTSKTDSTNEVNTVSSTSSDISCSDSISTTTNNGESVITSNSVTDTKPDQSTQPDKQATKDENEVTVETAKAAITNGDVTQSDKKEDICSSTTPQENGNVSSSPKGKGKAIMKKTPKSEGKLPPKNLRVRTPRQMYSNILDGEEESDTEDENDVTFEGAASNSSSEAEGEEDAEESSEEADDEDEDDDDDEDNDEDLYEDDNEFTRNMTEEPGSDSGCTAVVALLHGNELYVANAGDSRCIVCRKGEAVEMSFDHKPEDEPEMARVVKAGGKVTQDGRVNGGLNLSRAIGDHAYKQNKQLSDREQMITALPDVRTLTINPNEDEFMVLACDGIWNFMSSQEVVDFVRPRLQEGREKLSAICEEMFDHCLAPHTMGDGTGCDNMTAVIVQFKNIGGLLKRAAETSDEQETSAKRAKTDEVTSVTTASAV